MEFRPFSAEHWSCCADALDKLEITAAEAQEARGFASALTGALQAAQGLLEQVHSGDMLLA